MLSLNDLQKEFVKGLHFESDAILRCIHTTTKLSPAQQIGIYQSSVIGAKQKTLREIYTTCNKLVGEDFFVAMINEYIAKTISTSPDLADYGENFSEFIIEFEPAKGLPYLSDVAKLEWAWHKLFNAPTTKELNFERLAECYTSSGENIIFHLPQSCTLITSYYPIHRIWEVNQDDYVGEQIIRLSEHEFYYFLIWRNDLKMRIDLLDAITWKILTSIQARKTLNEIANELIEKSPNIDFTQMLTTIVDKKWIAGFEIKN